MKKLKLNAVLYCFALFTSGGPCQCSGELISLSEQLVYLVMENTYISEFVLSPHQYCKY